MLFVKRECLCIISENVRINTKEFDELFFVIQNQAQPTHPKPVRDGESEFRKQNLQLTVRRRGQRSVGQEKQDRRSARNVENNYCNYLDLGTNWKRASGLFVFSILTAGLSCQLAQNILSSVAL